MPFSKPLSTLGVEQAFCFGLWNNVERLCNAAREGRSEAGGSTTDSAPPLSATIAGEGPARSVGEGATLAATGFLPKIDE